ncbi:MAG TPA: histidine phosphotransferase family protein [Stellaceae bacterium]|jgi:histidine phosphotransferase ChpT|nr:histidine phosphotransferase family protein [Stellaceae bacterium]
MAVMVELRVMELLNARLCHELISPVGAINNGVELVAEEDADADFQRDAMKLIASSAKTAGQRLNFYRFAYGSGRGSTGKDASTGLLEGGKVKLDWDASASALPLEWQRLAGNMVVIAAEILPRGGTLRVAAGEGGKGIVVNAAGDSVNLTPELRAAIGEKADIDALTARTVHGYYTARVAESLDTKLDLTEPSAGKVTLTAKTPG